MQPTITSIFDELNKANGIQPPLDIINADVHSPVTFTSGGGHWNTVGTITPRTGEQIQSLIGALPKGALVEGEYVGDAIARWHRIDLSHYFMGIVPHVALDDAKTTHALIPLLQQRYELPIYPDDLVNAPLPVSKDNVIVTLKATPSSLGFTGEVDATFNSGPLKLVNVIQHTELDVLKIPKTINIGANTFYYHPDTYRCWGLDFTPVATKIKNLVHGSYPAGNWATVVKPAIELIGFFPETLITNARIYHYTTNDPAVVAYANPAFSHVSVISPCNTTLNSNPAATWYLHYNLPI